MNEPMIRWGAAKRPDSGYCPAATNPVPKSIACFLPFARFSLSCAEPRSCLRPRGLHGLLLPLRGQAEQFFSTTSLGLLGTAWAFGFVVGCFFCPRLVRRAGHIRSFAALAATAAIVALPAGLWIGETSAGSSCAPSPDSPWPAPFMINRVKKKAGSHERATNENRGTVFPAST